jgi:hypothetical protein
VLLHPIYESAMAWYSNETLTSLGGDLSVVVYLPRGVKPGEPVFYYGSRFDHSSMIGSITRKKHYTTSDDRKKTETHVLYGTDMWRIPHNPQWPESGAGLAAEFGVGDNGAFFFYRCGWKEVSDVTNGVLGYSEANNGEPFLKIGVGALVKGSCPSCDSSGDYMFNSPYLFHEEPQWTMEKVGDTALIMRQKVVLNNFGYRLAKEVSLMDNVLTVTSTLTNLGTQAFSTVWYSHNFFTCDGVAVGPGYALDLNVAGPKESPRYDEPDTWSWTSPLADFAVVKSNTDSVHVAMGRTLIAGEKIKALFKGDGASNGGFRLLACDTSIEASIPTLEQLPGDSGFSMYAFNLYIERGTLSPEPQVLLNLDPGASKTWTQRLVFEDADTTKSVVFRISARMRMASAARSISASVATVEGMVGFCCLLVLGLLLGIPWASRRRNRRLQYNVIADESDDDDKCSKRS